MFKSVCSLLNVDCMIIFFVCFVRMMQKRSNALTTDLVNWEYNNKHVLFLIYL